MGYFSQNSGLKRKTEKIKQNKHKMRLTTSEISQLEVAIQTQAMKIRLSGIEFHIPKMPKSIVGSKAKETYAKGIVKDWVRDLGIVVVGGGGVRA